MFGYCLNIYKKIGEFSARSFLSVMFNCDEQEIAKHEWAKTGGEVDVSIMIVFTS